MSRGNEQGFYFIVGKDVGSSIEPWPVPDSRLGEITLRLKLTQVGAKLAHDRQSAGPGTGTEAVQGDQIAIENFSGGIGAVEAVLAQKTVEIGECLSSPAVVGTAGTSKRDEIRETIGHNAGKNWLTHRCTSGQSRGSCLS